MKRNINIQTTRVLLDDLEYAGWLESMKAALPPRVWNELKDSGAAVWKDRYAASLYTVELVREEEEK